MAMKSFNQWRRQEVQEAFGLERLQQLPLLDEWLRVDVSAITPEERKQIESLRGLFQQHALDWNEAEVKFHFLGPLMNVVDFHAAYYHSFVERPLQVTIGEETASGIVDFMVATGDQLPKAPYFCLHEYKPEAGSSNDVSGQLLIAMVAAQQANRAAGREIPIYGAFVIGRNFYFMVLEENRYAFSDVFPATQEDVFAVFVILRKVKAYIEATLAAESH
jgi:hypothetical protein